ncbi:MAG: hypothetical protein IT341_10540 [Chloroflexi bacterium]|nr:hypothetical protein [Chloroflexota bacterium]
MSGVVVIDSTWNSFGLNASPTQGIFLQHDHEELEYIGEDQTPAQVPGVFARPRRLHRRRIFYVGMVQADPAALDPRSSLRTYLTDFETRFQPTNHGNLVETLEDGSVRTLDCRAFGQYERPVVPEFAECTVVFESYESPDWDTSGSGS